ncbi:MAG: hypothetical protein E7660_03105 [Ruminococcaceae bacterium]|nr:hypothetical protein [Oscillospiraceae bacterium]
MAHNGKNAKIGEKRKAVRAGTASYLDRFARFIYRGLKNGVVGAVFTSYSDGRQKDAHGKKSSSFLSPLREAASAAFDEGRASDASKSFATRLLDIKLKVYGTFLMSFGIYTFLFGLVDNFLFGTERQVFGLLFGLILAVSALPLLFSDEAASSAVDNSAFGSALKSVSGLNDGRFDESEKTGRGRVSYGFIAGVIAGGIAYFVSPYKIVFVLLFIALLWITVSRPEFGMVALSFLLPFLTNSANLILISAVAVSFLVKLVRRKRFASFETLDASVFGVLLIILLGGIVASADGALGEAALYVLLISVYFLTVNLFKTKAWLDRATASAVMGLSASCLLYVAGFLGDMAFGGVSLALSEMLEGTLASQLIMGDKAVISAVSAVALPMAVSFFMRPAFRVTRGYSAAAVLLLILPVIFDGSVYSALAAALSVLLLLLIYSRNAIYIIFSGVITVPVASLLFPAAASRIAAALSEGFARFGRTRLELWDSISGALSDFLFGGVGFGKASFEAVRPMLSGNTPDSVAHSYNTYLQIWVETGVFGLVIFLVFAWLIVSSAFTAFLRIDRARKNPALRTRGIYINIPESLSQFASKDVKSKGKLSVNEYCVSRRMGIAAPLCSVAGMLFYGIFDYIWYNEKVFLLFWIAAGLSAAYSTITRNEIDEIEASYTLGDDREHNFEADIV